MAPQALATSTQERRSSGLTSVDGRTYPLRSAHIRARAEGGLALTTLIQEFHNPHDEALEVAYTMPLPADGAVLGYTIKMGERVIRGEIEVREKAEARYREALYQGRTAGLLEQDRADTFQQRLGNLPARTDVRVEIGVLQPLSFLTGGGAEAPHATGAVGGTSWLWEYRFPTVVGVRYAGGPGRVPDATRLQADRTDDGSIPTRFSLSLTVADEVAGADEITSPSHDIVTASSAEWANVSLHDDAPLDRDLVVRWAATTPAVGVRVVEGSGVGSDRGRYALVTITPPDAPDAAYPRDLTVLIDSSGSMSGQPIQLAKRVVESLLHGLGPGDRFEVLSFANRVERLTRGVVAAIPKAVERAILDVRGIQAGGGTEMSYALAEALRALRRDSQRQVVLVSDGMIGFEDEVVSKVRNMPAGVRVHAVGIGAAPNRSLTRFLARAGRGVELIACDDAMAAECAGRLRAATARPVLTDLRFGGSAIKGVAPAKPRDVLAGQPLVMAAELSPEGGAIEVAGNLAGSREVWGWRVEVTAAAAGAAGSPSITTTPLPVGALYGREAIADLEAEAGSGDRPAETIDQQIESLGLQHQITSRRTSLVAICEEATTDPSAPRRRERLAVELPAGLSAEGVGLFETAHLVTLRGTSRFMETTVAGPPGPIAHLAPVRGIMRPGISWGAMGKYSLLIGVVIHRDGDEIVLEIESPEDRFFLPSGEATILVEERKIGKARVVLEKSTPAGPHPRGVLVRLALRIEGGATWPESSSIVFEQRRERGTIDRLMILVQVLPAGGGPFSPARNDPPVA